LLYEKFLRNALMKKVSYTTILSVLLMFGVVGCSKSQFDELPGIKLDADKVNSVFIVYEDPVGGSANTHKNGEYLAVTGKNKGESNILFSPDSLKIFAKNDGEWVQIENRIRSAHATAVLASEKEFPPGMIIAVAPYVPDMQTPTSIRIFLEGCVEGTNEPIAAYWDITLQP